MKTFSSSELVLQPDGSVYHLNLKSHQVAETIILVGDPGRVPMVSSFFSSIEYVIQNREIVTHTGIFNGKRITVMSSGMGTDNIDICVNELHILASVDLEKKELLSHPRRFKIIRVGTSGALQANLPVDSVVASTAAIGFDNVLLFYDGHQSMIENDCIKSFCEHVNWPKQLHVPYYVECSQSLLNNIAKNYIHGITLSAPGFYGPQFRNLFIRPAFMHIKDRISDFTYQSLLITNFEMETSALYGLGKLLGHETLTVCLIIANRIRGEFSKDYKSKIKSLIEEVLYNVTL